MPRCSKSKPTSRKASGLPGFAAYAAATWDPIDPFERRSPSNATLRSTPCGEYRAAALNLANNTGRPMEVQVRAEGLPGSPAPKYLMVHEVPWTDTAAGQTGGRRAAGSPTKRWVVDGYRPAGPGPPSVVHLPCRRRAPGQLHGHSRRRKRRRRAAASAGYAPCMAARFSQGNHALARRMELHQRQRQLRHDAAKPPGVCKTPPEPLRQRPLGHGKRHVAVPVHGRSAGGAARYHGVRQLDCRVAQCPAVHGLSRRGADLRQGEGRHAEFRSPRGRLDLGLGPPLAR